jgi:hypothetical protein
MAGRSPRGTDYFAKGYVLSKPTCSSAGKALLLSTREYGLWTLQSDLSRLRHTPIARPELVVYGIAPHARAANSGERHVGRLLFAGHSPRNRKARN